MFTTHMNATPQATARHIATALRTALDTRGVASLAVSGGRSPIALFQALRREQLDWARVTVTLVDERIVPRHHEARNAALVAEHLLRDAAVHARFIPWFGDVPSPLNTAALDILKRITGERIADMPWPLDVVVLGMGEDGHTASLFSGARGFDQAISTEEPLAWIVPETAAHARLTLTLSALLAARELVLSIAGGVKLSVWRRATLKSDRALPVSLVLHQSRTPVSVWIA